VDTVDFLNPIEVGELVTMKASVNYVGNSSMIIGIRVRKYSKEQLNIVIPPISQWFQKTKMKRKVPALFFLV
jgi:acyl-CoA hydrolase